MTRIEAAAALNQAFPGVEFTVKISASPTIGAANGGSEWVAVSYNRRRFQVEPAAVQQVVPNARVWARGLA